MDIGMKTIMIYRCSQCGRLCFGRSEFNTAQKQGICCKCFVINYGEANLRYYEHLREMEQEITQLTEPRRDDE